ncbi:MAG: iron-containing alcohol dehydrogenase [Verrucomicrobiaceae bacterium]|nr:MAG: iron-containing alcohol dehydrogenase [Verrucomicrobiaceae bacterium]
MISSFAFPTSIVHGPGALGEVPARLAARGLRRPLIVTDPGLLRTPAFQLLREIVPNPAIFSEVHPNPVEQDVAGAAAAFRSGGCDSVIGFGGGSALDVAKIARAASAPLDKPWHQLTWQDPLENLPPLIAIPTTAGTGSEVGRSSVITIGDTKRVVFHPALLAMVVILDPRLTVDLPPHLTAATGADALTHCIESFTSPVYHPLCDAIALEGLRLVFEYLPRAVENGSDLEARAQMQMAATMGGIAFQKDLGAAHSLSHPLSAHFHLNHGLANALCLLPVMRFNAQRKPGLYRRIGITLELPDPSDEAVIAATEALLDRIGIKRGLRGRGIDEAALDRLADAAFADSCHPTNPVPTSRDDLRALYVEAL